MSKREELLLGPSSFKLSNLRWFILAMDALLLALNYGDRAIIGVASPSIMKEFNFNSVVWGTIIGAFSFGYAPFCFIGGWTADKLGPRKIMGWAGIWWSIFTALTVAGFNFVSFLILRFLFGFGEGPQGSVMTKLVGNWFPQRETGTAVGIAQAATPLGGAIFTPIVVWMIATTNSWRTPFVILGAFGILLCVGWFVVVRDKPEQHPWITVKELAKIQRGNSARQPELTKDGSVPKVREYFKQPYVWSTAFAFFGYAWVLFTFLSWFPVYLVQAHGINIKDLSVSATIPWVAGTIGTVLGGIITDWIGRKTGKPASARKWMIVVCLMGVGITFAPTALVTSLYGAVALMSVAVFLLYLSCAQYFAIITDLVPSSSLGSVMGFVHFIANTAGIIAPIITGALVAYTHTWGAGFGVGAVLVFLGAIGMILFGKSTSLSQNAKSTVEM